MRIAALLVVVAGLGVVPASGQTPAAASRRPASVYVSEFVSHSVTDKALLASFTDEFETALVNSGRHRVLNRRNLQKVLAEAQSESYVASMRDLSTQARARIPALEGAEGVLFGEVTDDTDSGDVSIAVTLESFDSVIHWKQSVSMKRGLLRDLASRRAAMEGLARTDAAVATSRPSPPAAVTPTVPAARGGGTAEASGAPRSPNERIRATVDQFVMSPDKRRASLAVTIENLAGEPVNIAFEHNGRVEPFAGPKVSLVDDLTATWYVQSVVGLQVVPCCYRNLGEIRQEDFTVLGTAERIRVVILFSDDNNGVGTYRFSTPPGFRAPTPTTFSFTADALYYLASGPQRFSIRLPSIGAPR